MLEKGRREGAVEANTICLGMGHGWYFCLVQKGAWNTYKSRPSYATKRQPFAGV